MSLITTSSFESDLLPGLIREWFGEYKDIPTMYDQYMKMQESDQAYEIYGSVIPLGASQRKPQGSALSLDTSEEFFKPIFTNICFASGFEITKEMRMNGKAFGNAKKFTEQLRRGDRVAREIVGASVLNNSGVSGKTMLNGDGVILASASHPMYGSTFSNLLANNADLSELAIEAMNVQVLGFTDNRGIKIDAMLDTLVISPSQIADAHRITQSTKRVDTADNTASFIYDTGLIKKIVVNRYLTSTVQWQVTTSIDEGLIFQNRQSPEIDTDNVFLTKNSQVSIDSFFTAGWKDPRGVIVSLGT